MAYLGKGLKSISTANISVDTMTGNGSTTTMGISLGNQIGGSVNDINVYISGVQQRPGTDYTLSGSTITFTTAPADGWPVVAFAKGDSWEDDVIDSSVTTESVKDGAVTDVKITSLSSSKLTGALPAISGAALTGIVAYTKSASNPTVSTNPTGGTGTLWVNQSSGQVYVCTDATAGENVWTNVGSGTGDIVPYTFPGTAFGYTIGGYTSTTVKAIDKFSFTSQADATVVGDLETVSRATGTHKSTSHGWSSGRGVWNGGSAKIEKVAFASDGDAVDSNIDLSSARGYHAGASSSTHGYTMGGSDSNETSLHNIVDKFSFSSTGTANNIGTLHTSVARNAGQSSETHGYSSGGTNIGHGTQYNNIQKMSFSTDEDMSDVADLTVSRSPDGGGGSSATHGYTAGGYGGGQTSHNTIDKFTFASGTPTVSDHGDLFHVVRHNGVTSASDAMYVTGGWQATNIIQKITIASNTNSVDWADLTVARYSTANPSY